MAWNAQIGRELRELDGIVAILLSLAGLAERAAGSPLPIRWLVLRFLRQAEAVATEFVAGSAGAAYVNWSPDPTTALHGSRPADAINLALSLSMLAQGVAALATQLRRQAFLHRGRPSGGKSRDRHLRHGIPGAFGMTVPQAARHDTS